MSIVADASVVLAWFFDEDHTPQALEVLRRIEKEGLLVPPLLWSELENGILTGERKRLKKCAESEAFLKLVRDLPMETDERPRHRVSDEILDIGRRFQLTSYDATYVELAWRESVSLATFDRAMRTCAKSMKIRLIPASN